MLEKNIEAVSRDVKLLISDAQELIQAAATLTGDKAEELQHQGVLLLEAAVAQLQQTHAVALANSKRMALSADHYVQDNPWRSVGAGAGIGLLLGVMLARR
jgi:ElaB/YqjD/DUF883 family membrane-anchored ribosome-binding protein